MAEEEEPVSKILEKKKRPSILGSGSFVDLVKEGFFLRKTDVDIPQAKELAPDVKKIKKMVVTNYGITEDELLQSRRGVFNEARNVAIYLSRRLRGDSLKQIGEQYHINKYSSASSVVERMKALMAADRELSKRVEKITTTLIKSQKQT